MNPICPCCKSQLVVKNIFNNLPTSSAMLDITPSFEPLTARFDAGICNHCKHITNESETRFDFTYSDARYVLKSAVSNTMNKNLQLIIDFIVQGRTDFTGFSVMEIGSGAGEVANWFANQGASVTTVDPAIVGYEDDRITHHKIILDESAHDHIDTKFDLIIGRHIIEHTNDPGAFLDVCRSFLNPTGQLYLEVPNLVNTLISHRLVDFFNDHIQYFTFHSMELIAGRRGFAIKESSYWLNGAHMGVLLQQDFVKFTDKHPVAIDIKEELKVSRTVFNQVLKCIEDADRVAIYGAGAHACTFISQLPNYLKDKITHVFDKSDSKHNRYLPGLAVPITSPSKELIQGHDLIVNTSSLYTQEVEKYIANDLECNTPIVHL